jgi:hypothetical protein
MTTGPRAQNSEEIEYFPEDEGFIKLLTEAATKKIINVKAPVAAKTTVKCKYSLVQPFIMVHKNISSNTSTF